MTRFGAWLSEGTFAHRLAKNFAACLIILVLIALLAGPLVHQDVAYRILVAVVLSLGWGLLRAWSHDRS